MAEKQFLDLTGLQTFKEEYDKTIPKVADTYSATSGDAMSGKAVAAALESVGSGTIVSEEEPADQKENGMWLQPYE